MKTQALALPFALVSLFAVGAVSSVADDNDDNVFRAQMSGYNEVPAVSSTATGSFSATLSSDGTTLTFRLTYANLVGGDPVAAHIHFGQAGVAGGVAAFLCGGGSKPACPPAPATVTGTIVATDVIGPVAQGIAAGDLMALVRAMRRGKTYANAHNAMFPGGTLRGQISARD